MLTSRVCDDIALPLFPFRGWRPPFFSFFYSRVHLTVDKGYAQSLFNQAA